jgi:hypothetical protein
MGGQAFFCGAHRDQDMKATEPEVSTQAVAAVAAVVEEVRDLLSADGASAPEAPAEEPLDFGSTKLTVMIQTMSSTPVVELDRLIGELQEARDYLQSECERIERETTGYVELSQTALESVKIIAETVGEWRKAGHPVRAAAAE